MIQINKDWRIKSDAHNIILQQRRVSEKSGNERWDDLRFYNTLPPLFHDLVELGIKETQFKNLEAIEKKIEQLHKDIDKFFKHYKDGAEWKR